MKRRNKRIVAFLSILLILSGAASMVMVHKKVLSVRTALEHLVSSKTEGKYTLIIQDYTIDWRPFKITFDSLRLVSHDSDHAPVKQVLVPHLVFSAVSVLDFIRGDQLEVRSLTIDEPFIELTPGEREPATGVQFSQQILKLYPAVEALLERFNVVHFEIRRASMDIRKHEKTELQLNLIDLLLENWNVKELQPDRQLRLAMGSQQVNLSKGAFAFSGLEYDFKKRELRFSDFSYASEDTLTLSKFQASGEFIVFKRLDYTELFQRQRLVYEKLTFEHPVVQARFQLKNKKEKNENTQKMITDMVRRSVGAFSLDSAYFHKAAIHLTLLMSEDSIDIDLPAVTIKTDQIRLIPDSLYTIGDIEVDMDQTKLALKDNLVLSVDKLFFGRDDKLVINNLNLYQRNSKMRIAAIQSIEMTRMDLFQLVSKKRLTAHALEIWNAKVRINPDELSSNHNKGTPKTVPSSKVDIGKIMLHNSSVIFEARGKRFQADQVNGALRNVKTDSTHALNFFLEHASVGNAVAKLNEQRLTVKLDQFSLSEHTAKVNGVTLAKDDISVSVRNIVAAHKDFISDVTAIDQTRWDSIAFEQIDISGSKQLSPRASTKDASNAFQFASGKIKVKALLVNLQSGDTTLSGSLSDISIVNATHDRGRVFGFDVINGFSDGLHLQTNAMLASVENLKFQWPNSLAIGKVAFAGGSNKISLNECHAESIKKQGNRWMVSSLNTKAIQFTKEDELDVTADSILVQALELKPNAPHTSFVEVFNPKIVVHAKDKSEKKTHTSQLSALPVDRFVVHPGRVELPGDKVISFGKIIGDIPDRSLAVKFVEHQIPKSIIHVSNFLVKGGQMNIDSLMIRPNETWYAEHQIEDGKLRMKLSTLTMACQPLDSIFTQQKLDVANVEVGNLDVLVTRDKRLPDPPEIEKPWSLGVFFKLPSGVSVRNAQIQDGDIVIYETSDKTGQTGVVTINDVRATIDMGNDKEFNAVAVDASARLYNQGVVQLKYTTTHPDTFRLEVRLRNFDLRQLNQIVLPSQSIEIQSGYLKRFLAEINATNDNAVGAAGIGYKKLHITFHRKGDQEKKGLAAGLMNFIADGIVLKNSRKWVRTEFDLDRIKHKSVFNYWVRLSARGAIEAALNGK